MEEGPQTSQGGQNLPQTPPPTAQNSPQKPVLQSLRTFRGDIQAQVEDKNLSLLTLAQKEDERRQALRAQALKTPPKSSNTLVYIGAGVLGLALVGAGAWGLFSILGGKPEEIAQTIDQNQPQSLVFAEKTQQLDVSSVQKPEDIGKLVSQAATSAEMEPGSILQMLFTVQNQGETLFIDAASFLGAFSNTLPANFIRSLDPNFMFGSYLTARHSPFLILNSQSYEIARAGLLSWEQTMCTEIAYIFLKNDCVGAVEASWTDETIRNTDVRELRDANGHTILLYAFLSRETIVIAQNQATFIEILTRYHTPKPVVR